MTGITITASLYLLWKYQRRRRTQCRFIISSGGTTITFSSMLRFTLDCREWTLIGCPVQASSEIRGKVQISKLEWSVLARSITQMCVHQGVCIVPFIPSRCRFFQWKVGLYSRLCINFVFSLRLHLWCQRTISTPLASSRFCCTGLSVSGFYHNHYFHNLPEQVGTWPLWCTSLHCFW